MNVLTQQRALIEIDKVLLFKQAERCRQDFGLFFRHFAWPALEPATKYIHNWHIDAICEHLQAITRGQITRLIINLPFRLLKSSLVSQSWPVWEWLNVPSTQWLTASAVKELAVRDAVNSRRIIESPAFQECYGHLFQMTTDQNVKSHYENTARGTRYVTSTDSAAIGFGGNRILVDDPLTAKGADSQIARDGSWEWFKGTISTRFNNPAQDAAVVVHQRLHKEDLTGHLLEEQPGMWEHLVLPMNYETKRTIFLCGRQQEVDTDTISTATGFVDPRRTEGELLFPERLPAEAVAALKVSLGKYHVDAQLQQRPASRGGVIFARGNWRFYKVLPELDEKIISVDCSFKDLKHSDYVALQVWGRKGAEKFLIKRIREQLSFSATVLALRALVAQHPTCVAKLIEDKANGSAIIDTVRKEIAGIIPIEPEGGKVARAFAVQPEHEAGNLWLPDPSIDPEIETFISETASFPNVAHDDETDCFTQAINWYRNRTRTTAIIDFYAAEVESQRVVAEERIPKLPPSR